MKENVFLLKLTGLILAVVTVFTLALLQVRLMDFFKRKRPGF